MHVIRLRRPWTKIVGDRGTAHRVDVPDHAAADQSAGNQAAGERVSEVQGLENQELVVRYQRRFNRPTNLGESSVSLRMLGWEGRLLGVSLNQRPICLDGVSSDLHADVTPLLQAHNVLEVTLSGTVSKVPRLTGEVTLAIEDRSVT